MIKYRTETIEQKIAESIVCDVCKKEYGCSGNTEAQEFQHIRITGGYGSVFGDGAQLEADICQYCFKEIMGKHLRDVTEVV